MTKQSSEELALAAEQTPLIFMFNHALPGSKESEELIHRIFQG